MAGDKERYIEAGMEDYLSKPFSRADLAAVLDHWLTGDAMAAGAVAGG